MLLLSAIQNVLRPFCGNYKIQIIRKLSLIESLPVLAILFWYTSLIFPFFTNFFLNSTSMTELSMFLLKMGNRRKHGFRALSEK